LLQFETRSLLTISSDDTEIGTVTAAIAQETSTETMKHIAPVEGTDLGIDEDLEIVMP
jgi:deoxyxylulose-5-phosphate synthase